jgi:hypothetical protein
MSPPDRISISSISEMWKSAVVLTAVVRWRRWCSIVADYSISRQAIGTSPTRRPGWCEHAGATRFLSERKSALNFIGKDNTYAPGRPLRLTVLDNLRGFGGYRSGVINLVFQHCYVSRTTWPDQLQRPNGSGTGAKQRAHLAVFLGFRQPHPGGREA